MFDDQIKNLNNEERNSVLYVISSNRIEDAIKEAKTIEAKCPSYTCCPCDSKTGDSCGCNADCYCGSHLGTEFNLQVAKIYETLRYADTNKISSMFSDLKKKLEDPSSVITSPGHLDPSVITNPGRIDPIIDIARPGGIDSSRPNR